MAQSALLDRSGAEAAIDAYVESQARLDVLRFITCGSVDDGKSTLIGRLLYESKLIFDDQLEELEVSSRKHGTQGADIDFALLVDGLAAEREQGITIDVAYRFFHTDRRRFVVADTPGHEQYTRNMVTGASTADVAVILVDARHGILPQTRRHSFIASLVGIDHVVLAVNKMDICDWSQARFAEIVAAYQPIADHLGFASVTAIPMSALRGDNVVDRSPAMAWYGGPTLIEYLNTATIPDRLAGAPLRFPVQWVNRPNLDFRGFAGTVEAGSVRVGDRVRILPSGEEASVTSIVLGRDRPEVAQRTSAVTITLDREVDVSRGDVIVEARAPCAVADRFSARLVWMDGSEGTIGRSFWLKTGTTLVNATITAIEHRIEVNSFEPQPATALGVNDICMVAIALDRPVPLEPFARCAPMGRFILIDRQTSATVAAGMVETIALEPEGEMLAKARVTRKDRERLNGHPGQVVWLCGHKAARTAELGHALEARLYRKGYRTALLDANALATGLNRDLAGTDLARTRLRILEVARLMADAGLIVLVAADAPLPDGPAILAPGEGVVIELAMGGKATAPAATHQPAVLRVQDEGGPVEVLVGEVLQAVTFDHQDAMQFHL